MKRLILAELWPKNGKFPGHWSLSEDLLKLTRQKYFDRRIRELRNESGCDIETSTSGGQYAYRLLTDKLSPPQSRGYLSVANKKKLAQQEGLQCAVCGAMGPEARLQADHRVPVIRSGSNDLQNWQFLCLNCNVSKRGACRGCEQDCQTCPWAFPDQETEYFPIRVPKELMTPLRDRCEGDPREIEEKIVELIERWLRL